MFDELAASRYVLPNALDIGTFPWLIVAAPQGRDRVRELREILDPGEAEAIALVVERQADLLLVDERRGRRIAKAAGIKVTGLLGVVAAAKSSGHIGLAKPVIDDLIRVAHFWIGPELYAEFLKAVDEA